MRKNIFLTLILVVAGFVLATQSVPGQRRGGATDRVGCRDGRLEAWPMMPTHPSPRAGGVRRCLLPS